ncbi:Thioredoxin [Desulfonema limicola]|uniref:Thioredoxin n=1 Tax=Desulfonema limicola TaxID=45656 RepID=A0A975GEK9_9BACT|nr:thioredoxin family protein [Desulfonema limicola]QTA78240.1 Thioredoxin [Desulfonema limicola]
MQTGDISGREFENQIKSGVSLIDFHAPWCAPCHLQEPIIRFLAKQFNTKAFVSKMNIEKNRETVSRLRIKGIPTLIIFKNGKEVQRFVGLQSAETLSKALEKILLQKTKIQRPSR